MPGRVLVTGGSGFIGSRLVLALLERGHAVTVLDVREGRLEGVAHPNLRLVGPGGDERGGGMVDPRLVEQSTAEAEVVYHLALNWDAGTWRRTLSLPEVFDLNVRGTLNLLEASHRAGVRHFVFSSSEAVYGMVDGRTIDEESTCYPESWERGDPGPEYAVLKLTTEKLCRMYHHQHGLPVTVMRIWVAFDDDDALLLSSEVVKRIQKGESVEVIEGRGRPSVHVDEIVEAFLLATLDQRAFGQVFNVLNPATYLTDQELCELLVAATGSASVIEVRPRTAEPVGVESAGKIMATLGWQPKKSRRDLVEAIVRTMQGWARPV